MICEHCGEEILRSSATGNDSRFPEWVHQGQTGYTNYTVCQNGQEDPFTHAEPWVEQAQRRLV